MKNYRNFFKKYYNIDFDGNYDIHHIDLNHNNNDIDNLMILPKKLHQKYHFYLNSIVFSGEITNKTFDASINGNAFVRNSYNLQMIDNFLPILNECNNWYDYKLYLEGILPNIHNIKL